jgi:hypothetical protein
MSPCLARGADDRPAHSASAEVIFATQVFVGGELVAGLEFSSLKPFFEGFLQLVITGDQARFDAHNYVI